MDITMTAVKRPSVIEKTLKSFTERLFFVPEDHRLIVNIDPVGEDVSFNHLTQLIGKYFPNNFIHMADEPSFPKAVKWVWSKVETEFFFHLEDDWIINDSIFMEQELITPLKENKRLACIRLYKDDIPSVKALYDSVIMFGCRYQYEGNLFKNNYFTPIPGSKNWLNQFGLNPVLIRKKFIDEALPLMDDDKNPEKQFRDNNPKMRNILNKWTFSIFGYPGMRRMVWGKNGLHWRQQSEFKKPRNGTGFTKWDKR